MLNPDERESRSYCFADIWKSEYWDDDTSYEDVSEWEECSLERLCMNFIAPKS